MQALPNVVVVKRRKDIDDGLFNFPRGFAEKPMLAAGCWPLAAGTH
jgi:hypothetical protein